jgi:hypothetical protein
VFENIRIKHFGYRGWSQYRQGYEAATGNHWNNIYISGGNDEGQQDLSDVNGRAMILGSHAQCVFNQLNIEWMKAPKILEIEVVGEAVFNSVNIEGVSLKATSSRTMGFVDLYFGHAVFNGLTLNNCSVLAANNVSAASVFRIGPGSTLSVNTARMLFTNKTTDTTPDFAFVRNASGGGDADVRVDLQKVNPDYLHKLDRIDAFTYSSGNEGALFGVLSDFNNNTPLSLPNANVTHYTFGAPGLLSMAPSDGIKNLTLSRQCTATISTRIPRGVTRRVRNADDHGRIQVKNHDGANLGGPIKKGPPVDFVFNGTDWVRWD